MGLSGSATSSNMHVSLTNDDSIAYLELRFSPSVELISLVRRFVFDFYRQLLDDEDAVSRVAVATHELLENAVRYSTDGAATVRIDVEPSQPQRRLTIRIENHADAAHRAALRAIFDELHGADDPHEHYRVMMHRNARRTDGSGLGLARIRAEAEMTLSCEIDDDVVRIVAQTEVAGRAAS